MTITITVNVKTTGNIQRIIEFIDGQLSVSPLGCRVTEVDFSANGTMSAKKSREALGLGPMK